MRIIKIHVTGFGKIQNTSYTLNDLNQIIAKNGNGKTTLATFIECMFYGMNTSTKDNHRRFLPWNKGLCGGYIILQTNNKTYKIERTFGSKKSEDTFMLYDSNNMLSQDYSSNIGEELFLMDRKAFCSTCFYSLDTDFAFNNQAVYERLNNIITQSDQLEGFDKKLQNLEKKIKEYENAQHKGIIPNIRFKIEEIKDKISRLSSAPTLYENALKEKETLLKEIKILKNKLFEQEKVIENIIASASNSPNSKKEFLDKEISNFKQKLLHEKNKINNVEINKTLLQQLLQKKQELILLHSNIDSLKQQILNYSIATQNNLPTTQEIENAKQTFLELEKLKTEKQSKSNSKKVSKGLGATLILISLMLIILGVYSLSKQPLLSFLFFSLTVIFFIFSIVAFLKNPLKNYNKKIQEKQNELTNFLNSINYGGYDFFSAISIIESQKINLNSNKTKLAELNRELLSKTNKYNQVNEHIGRFFESLGIKYNETSSFEFLQQTLQNIYYYTEQITALTKENQLTNSSSANLGNSEITKERNVKDKLIYSKELLEEKLNNLNVKISSLQFDLTSLQELNNALIIANTELKENLQQKDILQKTLYCLTLTKQNLTYGCLNPIKQVLNEYCGKILPKYTNFSVDESFFVTFECDGIVRDFNSLSLAEKQIIFLCIRLGVINALFKKQLPFLIIDDAFAPLDEQNFELCKSLLKEISKKMQILYLAPSSTRKL